MTERGLAKRGAGALEPASADLAERALRRALEPGSESTARTYGNAWARWLAWCAAACVPAVPVEPALLLQHLEALAAQYKPSTLRVALVAISQIDATAHALESREDKHPVRSHPLIRRWLARYSADASDIPKREAPPLERADMLAIIRTTRTQRQRGQTEEASTARAMRDRALLLVGWLGCLRRSEIGALTVGDVRGTDRGIELLIRSSKMDQTGKGAVVAIYAQRAAELCAARAWGFWLDSRVRMQLSLDGDMPPAVDLEAAAFPAIGPHGELLSALSGHSVAEIIRRRARVAGLEASGHSLRAGFATEAALQGRAERDIGAHGRWKTAEVLRSYVRRGNAWRGNPTEGLV